MRELRPAQWDLAGAGQAEEYRTITRNEIPRLDSLPVSLPYEAEDSQELSVHRAPEPIPLHWLPPRDDTPQVF